MEFLKRVAWLKLVSLTTVFFFGASLLPLEVLAASGGLEADCTCKGPEAAPEAFADPESPALELAAGLGWGSRPGRFHIHHWPDPVNVRNGNLFLTFEDFNIRGAGPGLRLTRVYNSRSLFNGPFGFGWSANYLSSLVDRGGTIELTDSDGSVDLFKLQSVRKGEEVFVSYLRGCRYLLRKPGGAYLLQTAEGRGFTYDPNGLLASISDRFGNRLKFSYRGSDLFALEDGVGRKLKFSYDAAHRVVAVTDPIDRSVHYAYSAAGDLIAVTDPMGKVTRFEYDPYHNLTGIIYPDTGRTAISYDEKRDWVLSLEGPGKKTSRFEYLDDPGRGYSRTVVTDQSGGRTIYEYHNRGLQETITDALGQRTQREFLPACGTLVSETDARGAAARYEYDSNCRLVAAVDRMGAKTRYAYDETGRLTEEVDPLGGTTHYAYDDNGNMTELTLPAGRRLRYEYDGKGRLKAATDAAGNRTRFEYDPSGNLTGRINPLGHATRYAYDPVGRLVGVEDPLGGKVKIGYNALDKVATVVLPEGGTLSYGHDDMGRISKATIPGGLSLELERDVAGRVTGAGSSFGAFSRYQYDLATRTEIETDEEGRRTEYRHDAKDRLTAVVDSLGNRTTYAYDANDNLVRIVDANGRAYERGYDAQNRITELKDPLGRVIRYTYDALGRPVKVTGPDGRWKVLAYDPDGRLHSVRLSDGSERKVTYDANGNAVTMEGAETTLGFTYDALNRVVAARNSALNLTLSYEYDAADRPSALIGPQGRLSYKWDAMGRLATITRPDGSAYRFSYHSMGVLERIVFPNGMIRENSFEPSKREVGLTYRGRGGETLYAARYGFDRVGNQLWKLENGELSRYSYDRLSRLISAVLPDGRNFLYAYDGAGNRVSKDEAGVITRYVYDEANQLTREEREGRIIRYLHDAGGNLVRRIAAEGITDYVYDADSRLTGVMLPDSRKITFGYDPLGRRLWKSDGRTRAFFLYESDNLAGILGEDQKPLVSFISGFDLDDYLEASRPGGEVSYFLRDGLNTVVGLADQKGGLAQRYAFLPFGQPAAIAASKLAPVSFTSRELDPDTGLYYMRARYYDAELGRFISQDPVVGLKDQPQSFNRYAYAFNNPVSNIDPTGSWGTAPTILAAVLVIGALVMGYRAVKGFWSAGQNLSNFANLLKAQKEAVSRLTNLIRDNPDTALDQQEKDLKNQIEKIQKSCGEWPVAPNYQRTYQDEINQVKKLEQDLAEIKLIRDLKKETYFILSINSDAEYVNMLQTDPKSVESAIKGPRMMESLGTLDDTMRKSLENMMSQRGSGK